MHPCYTAYLIHGRAASETQSVWLSRVDALTEAQRKEAREVLSGRSEADAALAAIELGVDEERRCPRCDTPGAVGKAHGLRRYLCKKGCGRTALTGTPLSRLRHKERWLSFGEALVPRTAMSQHYPPPFNILSARKSSSYMLHGVNEASIMGVWRIVRKIGEMGRNTSRSLGSSVAVLMGLKCRISNGYYRYWVAMAVMITLAATMPSIASSHSESNDNHCVEIEMSYRMGKIYHYVIKNSCEYPINFYFCIVEHRGLDCATNNSYYQRHLHIDRYSYSHRMHYIYTPWDGTHSSGRAPPFFKLKFLACRGRSRNIKYVSRGKCP